MIGEAQDRVRSNPEWRRVCPNVEAQVRRAGCGSWMAASCQHDREALPDRPSSVFAIANSLLVAFHSGGLLDRFGSGPERAGPTVDGFGNVGVMRAAALISYGTPTNTLAVGTLTPHNALFVCIYVTLFPVAAGGRCAKVSATYCLCGRLVRFDRYYGHHSRDVLTCFCATPRKVHET